MFSRASDDVYTLSLHGVRMNQLATLVIETGTGGNTLRDGACRAPSLLGMAAANTKLPIEVRGFLRSLTFNTIDLECFSAVKANESKNTVLIDMLRNCLPLTACTPM
jgi:hypothetical protein